MHGLRGWLWGWAATLRIKFFEPELYRILTEPIDFPEDFVEVERP